MNLSKKQYQALKLKLLDYGSAMRSLGLFKGHFHIELYTSTDKKPYATLKHMEEEADTILDDILEDLSRLYDRKPAAMLVKDDQPNKQEIL